MTAICGGLYLAPQPRERVAEDRRTARATARSSRRSSPLQRAVAPAKGLSRLAGDGWAGLYSALWRRCLGWEGRARTPLVDRAGAWCDIAIDKGSE
ncbi:MAG: hypothetical protein ACREXR_09545 [Gammaproteobacteria bacterium]